MTREIGIHCGAREFCANRDDESKPFLTPIDFWGNMDVEKALIISCMEENTFLGTRKLCPMIEIFVLRAEEHGYGSKPTVKLLKGDKT